ncbi:hypothetical protein V6255_08820 [Psychromonas arctica]|uniref:Uncharacterized protein n=1 Tax=Psychromonas arctica TaxID=168275 RepID=A0ABU9HC91_9GAMM
MSQHLINDFIHRTYLFKPFNNNKLTTQKLVKYQKSNDHNHSSPEDIEESVHNLKSIVLVKSDKPQEDKTKTESKSEAKIKHVDITI